MPVRTSWRAAPDAIDEALVPRRRLYTGATMPGIGLGTFGSDHVSSAAKPWPMRSLDAGHRWGIAISIAHAVYGNEAPDRAMRFGS
jgi:alcohol dehydrogenase (NADP+)